MRVETREFKLKPFEGGSMSTIERAPSTPAEDVPKSTELRMFLFLSVLLAPILSFILVGGYGFLIWMSQILLGPPSH